MKMTDDMQYKCCSVDFKYLKFIGMAALLVFSFAVRLHAAEAKRTSEIAAKISQSSPSKTTGALKPSPGYLHSPFCMQAIELYMPVN